MNGCCRFVTTALARCCGGSSPSARAVTCSSGSKPPSSRGFSSAKGSSSAGPMNTARASTICPDSLTGATPVAMTTVAPVVLGRPPDKKNGSVCAHWDGWTLGARN